MFEGCGLIETEGPIGKGALIFNLVKMVISALHRELECKVEKLEYKKFEVMQPRIKKNKLPTHEQTILDQSESSFTVVIDLYRLS